MKNKIELYKLNKKNYYEISNTDKELHQNK